MSQPTSPKKQDRLHPKGKKRTENTLHHQSSSKPNDVHDDDDDNL